jgi:hypothetical protein
MCLSQSKLQHDRRKPEETRLYQIISQHWQTFLLERAEEGRDVPKYIVDEFEAYLRCGILAYGFGRLYCPNCDTECAVAFSCKGRGFCPGAPSRLVVRDAWQKRPSTFETRSFPLFPFDSLW